MTTSTDSASYWPPLPLEEWSDTCDTLHVWTQMAGKVKLALSPFQNHYWHVALTLASRGLTTGVIPTTDGSFSIEYDFVDDRLVMAHSSGHIATIPLVPQSVASFYNGYLQALKDIAWR